MLQLSILQMWRKLNECKVLRISISFKICPRKVIKTVKFDYLLLSELCAQNVTGIPEKAKCLFENSNRTNSLTSLILPFFELLMLYLKFWHILIQNRFQI